MTTLRQIIVDGRERFRLLSNSPERDTELLVCHSLGIGKLDMFMNPNRQLLEAEVAAIRALFDRRAEGEPVQYLIGTEGFMGLTFVVRPGVLIPRADTELLVEKVIELAKDKQGLRILEIGTGSGAIAIALAHHLKEATVYTVDISEQATQIARENAVRLGVEDRVHFLSGDVFDPVQRGTLYDVVVSNPPYIPSDVIDSLQIEVAAHEPRLALDGGTDGYDFYRRIVLGAPDYLKEDGILALETGHDQARTISSFMKDGGRFENMSIHKDLGGIERVVIGHKRCITK